MKSRFLPDVRNGIRCVDHANIGIRAQRYKDTFRGLELLEVLSNGQRLPIARWPDGDAFAKMAKMAKVLDNGLAAPSTGIFEYREEDPARWQAALEDGLWLRGFWRVPWVIEAVHVGQIYTTGEWTSRGNIVRHNFAHHSMNANAFYVDDGDCGDSFLGNVAYKTESGGFIGGGSDQTFRHNIIIESPRANSQTDVNASNRPHPAH
jgi:hypothetical protein